MSYSAIGCVKADNNSIASVDAQVMRTSEQHSIMVSISNFVLAVNKSCTKEAARKQENE